MIKLSASEKRQLRNEADDRFRRVFDLALAAATAASANHRAAHGEHPFNCGFAWATLRPARGPFVSWLKRQGTGPGSPYGRHDDYEGGWRFWAPGAYNGQDMDVKRAGARAFADVLARELGLVCTVSCRLD